MEIGSIVGRYQIVSPVGEGGMGEVWRATDTSLEREVALKVLPAAFTEDAERRARFEREAKLLATLNHPNIATLYGLEEIDGQHLLVMEFIEGEDLAERLAHGPVPWTDARAICIQIAQALAAAHDSGIIHRDLKPANVKLRTDGTVKVLDFGLAKTRQRVDSGVDLTHSPTLTGRATTGGAILGTVGYMSPEQARGQPVGRQTDIWAFGCMLFEMLTGRRLFNGDTASDVIAGVLRSETDFDALPADTSPAIRRLLRRCLQRDPARRLHDFGDVLIELEDDGEELKPPPSVDARHTPRRTPGWLAAAVASSIAVVLGWLYIGSDRHEVIVYTEIARPGTAEFRFQGDVDLGFRAPRERTARGKGCDGQPADVEVAELAGPARRVSEGERAPDLAGDAVDRGEQGGLAREPGQRPGRPQPDALEAERRGTRSYHPHVGRHQAGSQGQEAGLQLGELHVRARGALDSRFDELRQTVVGEAQVHEEEGQQEAHDDGAREAQSAGYERGVGCARRH